MEHIDILIMFQQIFAWRTSVDILLLAAGFFFLYRTLRRLGTWKIVVGIVVATLIFLVANLLDLNGIKWIYSNLSNVVIIALIVIFQPELRKIFERAVSVRRAEINDPGEALSHMVADSLINMAEVRHGAIIVFPGKEPIEEITTGGYPINAQPSYPLLMSLFDPHSPGHDGAIIITRGQISRFGVRLPVSQSSELPEEYGTRHRAALGLAEKTDALIMVVSEERGKVSIFHLGKMKAAVDHRTILKAIQSHWRVTSSFPFELAQDETRRSFFLQVAASLLLAIFFWSTIIFSQQEMVERAITVPVEYSVSASDLVLVGEREQEIQLYLGGTKSNLDTLNPSNLSVKIDLSQLKPGTQTVFITDENIRLPNGVNLIEVIPSRLQLTLAEITEHWAEIKPQLVGELPQGVKIRSISVTPEKIKVISPLPNGEEKTITVTTTPIYRENITKDTVIYCKIIAPQTIQPVDKRWPDVEVTIKAER